MANRRRLAVLATVVSVSLLAAACSDDEKDSGSTDNSTVTTGDKPFDGKVVTIFSSIRDVEADRLETAWAPFEEATGIDIQHEGSATFEDDLKVRVEGGNAPDLAFVPQPGLLKTLVGSGQVVALSDLQADVEANDLAGWVEIGSVDGTFYAPPFGTNIKSLVWYSPSAFAEAGYEIPTTWQELIDLSDKIVTDGGTPWCVGVESGGATGWTLTDWVEDFVLRDAGADVYDQWVAHEIAFNDPKIVAAIDKVGDIVKNEDYVLNGVQSIPSTSFQEAGLPLLDGECFMHRQANFYGNQFPEDTTKGPEGDINAFYLPTIEASDPKVMLGGGEVITAFSDKPEVAAVAKYLTSAEYADSRLALGNWLTPNTKADISLITDPLEMIFAELLVSSDVFRFDGSDMMPSAVGAGTFWSDMVEWVVGNMTTQEAADSIEASWPKS